MSRAVLLSTDQHAHRPRPDFDALAKLAESALQGRALGSLAALGLTPQAIDIVQAIAEAVAEQDRPSAQAACERLEAVIGASGAEVLSTGGGIDEAGVLVSHRLATLCQPSGDKPPLQDDAGFRLSVGSGERSRLWAQLKEGEDCWLHLLARPDWDQGAEPVVALRYLHDNDPEQVAIRFRRNGVVLHKEIELPLPPGRPVFLSIGLIGGEIRVRINGIPVYSRPARYPVASGYMLDLIGVAGGQTMMALPLIAVQAGKGPALGASPEDEALLASGFVASARSTGQQHRLHEALHALAGAPLAYDAADIGEMIDEQRSADTPFASILEDLLLDRLEAKDRPALLASRPAPILRVRNVSIKLSSNPADKTLRNLVRGKKKVSVVDDVSFEAFSGDIVGIIGKNGAGKTTFLKSLVGAIPISSGRIDIEERPILLRPGAGMQPDLTGRQNIYKTGLYMDMSISEIDAMIDDVIGFAELEEHIDRPFRYYSDGMRARLIFSMATAMPRNILLLDELLSAGDMGFQERAMKRLADFLAHAKLVLVVQHTFDFVLTRCTKCLVLDKGVPVYFGDPRIATELYRESL